MSDIIIYFLLEKVGKFIGRQLISSGSGVEEQFNSLKDDLTWIRCVIEDAEKKRRDSPVLNVLVVELIDLAYSVEDVIDFYFLCVEVGRTHNFLCKISNYFQKRYTFCILGNHIEEIHTRIETLTKRKSEFDLQTSTQTQESSNGDMVMVAARQRSFYTVQEYDIVGLHKESALVTNWLQVEVPHRQVISIVGMGGLGKTTLAGMIYKNKNVSARFDALVWISVSQEYQLKSLLEIALKQVHPAHSSTTNMNNQELIQEIRKRLDNKRYLVVIDDIWKKEAWDEILEAFPNDEKGRIILTTRNNEVALYADSSCSYRLELDVLNNDNSWELFSQRVFSTSGGCSASPELVSLGEEIVAKCGGLPLAIVVTSGVLLGKQRTPNAWSRVLDSLTWLLSQQSNPCRQILELSYRDLPLPLKACFLYLGLFPEDVEIEAKKLIFIWVAEGFVQARGEQNMEDVADDFIEELVQRSLIQVTCRLYDGGSVEKFRVHDLLRDLALSEGERASFLGIIPNSKPPRRLAMHSIREQEQARYLTDPKFRSLLFFNAELERAMYWNWNYILGCGKRSLRVLELDGVKMPKGLPKNIGDLIFLHYLSLRYTAIQQLPSSIGKLIKLQTLDVIGTHIHKLPKRMWKLKNLRHLFLNPLCLEFETAEAAVMGDFGRNLLSLGLSVGFSFSTLGGDQGLSHFLVQLGCLRSLKIEGSSGRHTDQNPKFSFPPNLTELTLDHCTLRQNPSDVLGSLPNLKSLSLDHCSYSARDMDICNGDFPQLQFLCLIGLDLTEWRVDDGAMPRLRHLRIESCYRLKKLPDGLKSITTLRKIELLGTSDSIKNTVKEDGQDWDKFKHITFIITR